MKRKKPSSKARVEDRRPKPQVKSALDRLTSSYEDTRNPPRPSVPPAKPKAAKPPKPSGKAPTRKQISKSFQKAVAPKPKPQKRSGR